VGRRVAPGQARGPGRARRPRRDRERGHGRRPSGARPRDACGRRLALPSLRERLEEAAAAATQRASVVEVTSIFAALTLVGPLAREVFARFCALDLRPRSLPVTGFRPGSIARQPGLLVREGEDRFLFLFGWAVAHSMWTVVDDAGRHLGGVPIGVDALGTIEAALPEVSRA
jgi:glycine cleavage system aminomethyltransferase T